ncbi:MAG: hypothetical protein HYU56_04485 [Candidatus Aenigmarchaeota archaeon]|nr:hypothetical protein [Candidatus Aenigmarchaeota archaeon]MBS3053184.1 hypothetical protein [Candidatus Aenigmarchaeota archaeon]
MPETILGIPLNILFALIIVIVAIVFSISLLFVNKGSAENIISIIGGFMGSFFR